MSLVLMESADLANDTLPGGNAGKWASAIGSVTPTSVDGRTCWRIEDRQTAALQFFLPSGAEDDVLYIGCRFRTGYGGNSGDSVDNNVFRLMEGGTQHGTIELRANGTFAYLRDGSAEVARTPDFSYQADTWHYGEFKVKIHDSLGEFVVKIDGVEVLNATGLDTRNGGASGVIDLFQIGAQRGDDFHFRDLVLMNEQGSAFNDFIGPVIVEAVLPNGAGDLAEWTPDTGNNHERVDETTPDGDSSYVESTSAGDRDAYAFADLSAIDADPSAVAVHAWGRYASSPLDVGIFARRNATNHDGSVHTPSGSHGGVAYEVWEQDPEAAGAWTLANFNATQFGVRSA